MSLYDAIAFCRWLTAKAKSTPSLLPSKLQGRNNWHITLPTEWQWEKAARGFDGRRYPWGQEYISGYANIDERGINDGPHYLQETSAVGMYPQNRSPFGVVDLSGNIWEYCLNEDQKPAKSQKDEAVGHIARGGSWFFISNFASALDRIVWSHRYSEFGFRVVVGLFSVQV